MTQNDLVPFLFADGETVEVFQGSFKPMLPPLEGGFVEPGRVTDADVAVR